VALIEFIEFHELHDELKITCKKVNPWPQHIQTKIEL